MILQSKGGVEMKTMMIILLFALTAPVMAGDIEFKANAMRYVADDLEIVTLPDGEVVTRLVSRSRVTARQHWVDSVYGGQKSLVVYQGNGVAVPRSPATQTAQSSQQRGFGDQLTPNPLAGELLSQVLH
jgi:hypothetical protein